MTQTLPSIQTDVLLKKYCTLGIGGPARFFTEVHSQEELIAAIQWANEREVSFFILGKGSNLLFDDRGFNGLVVLNKIDFFEDLGNGKFRVGAGFSFALLGVRTARAGYSGLEFASGIPATVGGAVFMNAGANTQETCDCLESVEFLDNKGLPIRYQKEQLEWAYRFSSFQKLNGAIVSATFQLSPSSEAREKQLQIVSYRQKTQPYSNKSAGCIFKNPSSNSAGALIDQCGLKGMQMGDAAVSTLHANFLINQKAATAKEFLALADQVKAKVKEKTGIELELELRVIPF